MTKRLKPQLRKLGSVLSDIGNEYLHSLHYWRHNLKGNRVEKKYFTGKTKYPPVLLVQGFMGTRGVLQPLEKFLRAQGRDVISMDLGLFNIHDIEESASYLDEKIERLLDKFQKHHAFEKIDVIGHSMGGLIGLYYLKKLGGHRVINRLITLGAPFHGTWAGMLAMLPLGAVSKGLWQMLPPSGFLKRLRGHPERAHDSKIISIAAKYDAICPPSSCRLEGAQNVVIDVGHGGLLMDERVFRTVLSHLSPRHAWE